jgi:hypothetical protein
MYYQVLKYSYTHFISCLMSDRIYTFSSAKVFRHEHNNSSHCILKEVSDNLICFLVTNSVKSAQATKLDSHAVAVYKKSRHIYTAAFMRPDV